MKINFDNTYSKLPQHFYQEVNAASFKNPQLLKFNSKLAEELGLELDSFSEKDLAQIFTGQKLLNGSYPIALAYAGHQFGHFVPQLGDGRAMLLGEVVNLLGKRYDIQLKGSGETFFSRNGDGFSALGPVIREYIVSEAMHHLDIPTTRALAAVSTGEKVFRDEVLPGGVFTRVASSHIRIGTFEYYAAQRDIKSVKTLLEYSILRHYPDIEDLSPVQFLRKVMESQVTLVAKWMSIGFIHGVMNTDNTSISGETIDYGPCAFMDHFSFNKVFSFIDQQGRYAYMNQGPIIMWNLSRLADCLIPLVDADENRAISILNENLSDLKDMYKEQYLLRMRPKLGLFNVSEEDEKLILLWFNYLEKEKLDFTLSFRQLPELLFHNNNPYFKETKEFNEFFKRWKKRVQKQGINYSEIKTKMNEINPLYIPRNHQVERAIDYAIKGDFSVFYEMNELLQNPFQYNEKLDQYKEAPLPQEEVENTFCGT